MWLLSHAIFTHSTFGLNGKVPLRVILHSRVVANVLLVWLENFPGDFKKDSSGKLLKQLQTFTKSELKGKHREEILRKTQQLLDTTLHSRGRFPKVI